jgi:hypothetical protein
MKILITIRVYMITSIIDDLEKLISLCDDMIKDNEKQMINAIKNLNQFIYGADTGKIDLFKDVEQQKEEENGK